MRTHKLLWHYRDKPKPRLLANESLRATAEAERAKAVSEAERQRPKISLKQHLTIQMACMVYYYDRSC